jgi:nitroimidazol reductase NimA-like FMN-containing flavoprotein (pyridoxamine 5'-phosphate oxidase superfamily)
MEPISDDLARQFLSETLVGHIGVISGGEPYVTPMSYVVDGDRLLFRTKPGQRYEAMMNHPVVSVEASDFELETGDWTSVIVKGTATEVRDDESIDTAVSLLLKKYEETLGSPLTRGGLQPMATFPHVVQIAIDEITGMRAGGGLAPRTRPGRL